MRKQWNELTQELNRLQGMTTRMSVAYSTGAPDEVKVSYNVVAANIEAIRKQLDKEMVRLHNSRKGTIDDSPRSRR